MTMSGRVIRARSAASTWVTRTREGRARTSSVAGASLVGGTKSDHAPEMGVVLIVDDDASLRTVFERTVVSLGHRAITADGVDRALELVDAERIDLVLTDWQMGPRDGLSLLRALHARSPHLPVVLMSGNLDPDVRDGALRLGARAAIDKPMCFQWLRLSLDHVLAAGAAADDTPARAPSAKRAPVAPGLVPRVLIVEDDDDVREAIAMVVEREGFEPVCKTHGLEALRYLDTCDRLPSIILLDLMMPVMDGWEFLRRRSERTRDIPVVVITAGNPGVLPGNTRCLTKPLSVDVLAGELRPCWAAKEGR
jgi:CheY-like chemotaxis protein